ncbi:hypothetical protein ACFFTM_19070 [Pseudoduganella plicata]|nr:hypothetical protein [Pseudoduganella plicata]QBQ34943.1 hypothetical protein E1742_01170 [Pseudoduganella plicata]
MPPFDSNPFTAVLILHGLLAGVDVLLNHELLARLPYRSSAAREELLHAVREAMFAFLFLGLAWWTWHGAFAWLPTALLAAEVLISAYDTKIEGDTRTLPTPERILHVFLFINLGALIVLLGQQAGDWHALPTELAPARYGWAGWLLSALGIAAAAWTVRDGCAWLRLRNRPADAP